MGTKALVIGQRVGAPVDRIATYLKCEYQETTGGTTTSCANYAILMPGYYRACAKHTLHILRHSLLEYANREAAAHDSEQVVIQVAATLDALNVAQDALKELT